MACEPTVLILDEATSALDSRGVDIVLDLMRGVAAKGSAVLFVTHRLSEVMRVADVVTVLRDGMFQGTHEAGQVDAPGAGRADGRHPRRPRVPRPQPRRGRRRSSSAAEASAGSATARSTSSCAPATSSGSPARTATASCPCSKGLACDRRQRRRRHRSTAHRIRSYGSAVVAGIVYLSSDRKAESLFSGLSIGDNLGLGVLDDLSTAGVMRLGSERDFVTSTIDKYRIRVGNVGQRPPSSRAATSRRSRSAGCWR